MTKTVEKDVNLNIMLHSSTFISFQHTVNQPSAPYNWSAKFGGGAMVMGKLPVPGRPTDLDYIRARSYCTYSRCGLGLFGHFCHLSFLSSVSLSLGDGPI